MDRPGHAIHVAVMGVLTSPRLRGGGKETLSAGTRAAALGGRGVGLHRALINCQV